MAFWTQQPFVSLKLTKSSIHSVAKYTDRPIHKRIERLLRQLNKTKTEKRNWNRNCVLVMTKWSFMKLYEPFSLFSEHTRWRSLFNNGLKAHWNAITWTFFFKPRAGQQIQLMFHEASFGHHYSALLWSGQVFRSKDFKKSKKKEEKNSLCHCSAYCFLCASATFILCHMANCKQMQNVMRKIAL